MLYSAMYNSILFENAIDHKYEMLLSIKLKLLLLGIYLMRDLIHIKHDN